MNVQFKWKAINQEGRMVRGVLAGENSAEIRRRLFGQGYYPLEIEPEQGRLQALVAQFWQLNQARDWRQVWADLTQRLALLLQSGIPLLPAVRIMTETDNRTPGGGLGWETVKEKLAEGKECSEALGYLNPPPTPLILAIIKAGEQTGKLAEAMLQISRDLEDEVKFRRKLAGAYSYPVFLLIMAIAVIYALSVMVLPVYEKIFSNLNAGLPPLTLLVFSLSYWLPLVFVSLLLCVLAFVLVLRLRYPERWQAKLVDSLVRIPILGKIYSLKDGSHWTYILAILLEAGVPLVDALQLAAATVKSDSSRRLIENLGMAAREGKRLAPVLRRSHFPPEAALMLALGEESGKLTEMLHSIARIFRNDLEKQMELLPRVVGPAAIMVISGLIGLVAVGVLLPIFEVGTHLE